MNVSAMMLHIIGGVDPTVTAPESSDSKTGSGSVTHDAVTLAPSWGTDEETLFIVACAHERTAIETHAAAVSGYGGMESFASAQETAVGACWKTATAASENPAAFANLTAAHRANTYTIAVKSAGGAVVAVDTRTGQDEVAFEVRT